MNNALMNMYTHTYRYIDAQTYTLFHSYMDEHMYTPNHFEAHAHHILSHVHKHTCYISGAVMNTKACLIPS